jgi:multidrug resistance efflux pump
MEILLLLIYASIVWYVFIKKKWLPWTFVTQVLVVAFPVVALTILILFLNICAPESKDVRVINYVVPVEPNRPVKKGDVLFRLDPVPFQLDVTAAESNLNALRAKLLTSQANARGLGEQLKQAAGKRVALSAKLDLARKRVVEYQALAATGAVASQLPMQPVMSFVLNEQWVVALFEQNAVRKVEPGNRAEIALRTHPGRIIKCVVSSVVWATAQGQMPISGGIQATGTEPVPEGRLAVRLDVDKRDSDIFLAGARGQGAIYTNGGKEIQILRRVLIRVHTKLDWLILKL